jgi:hypothetical protein
VGWAGPAAGMEDTRRMCLAILTLSCVSIPTMREDRNPPREDSVLAMPNMVPATARALSEL